MIDAGRSVGRIYKTNAPAEDWFWGAYIDVVGETIPGNAPTFEEAKAKFKAAYLDGRAWTPA